MRDKAPELVEITSRGEGNEAKNADETGERGGGGEQLERLFVAVVELESE